MTREDRSAIAAAIVVAAATGAALVVAAGARTSVGIVVVRAVLGTGLATFAAGLAGFFRIELVGVSALVGRAAAHAGDLALLVFVHPGEAAAIVAILVLLAALLRTLIPGLVLALILVLALLHSAALVSPLVVAILVLLCHDNASSVLGDCGIDDLHVGPQVIDPQLPCHRFES
jgi:hypothetical protein